MIIKIDSNPNEVISASIGTLFIRENSTCFIRRSGARAIERMINLYRPKEYARKEFAKATIEYNTPYEIWEKVSGGSSNLGWQLIGYVKYFGNAEMQSLTPDTPAFDESAPMVDVEIMYVMSDGTQLSSQPTMSYDTLKFGYYLFNTAGTFFSYIKQVRNIPETSSFDTGSEYCVSASNMYDSTASFWEVYASGELYFKGPTGSFTKITGEGTQYASIEIRNPYIQDPRYNYKNINTYDCPLYEQPLYTVSESIGRASIVVNNVQTNGLSGSNINWMRGWSEEANRDSVYRDILSSSLDIYGGTLRFTMHPKVSCWFDFGGYSATGGDVYVFPDKHFDINIAPSKYTKSLRLALPELTGDYTNVFSVWLYSGSERTDVGHTADASGYSAGEAPTFDISDVFRENELPDGLIDPVTLMVTTRTKYIPDTGSLEVAFDITVSSETGSYSLNTITNLEYNHATADGWEQGWPSNGGHMQAITFPKFSDFGGTLTITRTAP